MRSDIDSRTCEIVSRNKLIHPAALPLAIARCHRAGPTEWHLPLRTISPRLLERHDDSRMFRKAGGDLHENDPFGSLHSDGNRPARHGADHSRPGSGQRNRHCRGDDLGGHKGRGMRNAPRVHQGRLRDAPRVRVKHWCGVEHAATRRRIILTGCCLRKLAL